MELGFGLLAGALLMPWYWLGLLGLLILADVILVSNDWFGGATGTLLVGGLLITFFGADVNPFTWVWANPGLVLEFVSYWLLAGAFWSIVRWYLFLLKVRARTRASASQSKQQTPLTRPRDSYASENKSRITGWIAYWPFSIVGYFLGDFLTNVFKNVYRVLSSLYEKMGNAVFAGFEER